MKQRARSILIIDDSKTFVMYVGMLLKRMGFDIITANSGVEGLALLRALNPDAVLLDLTLPDMDGFSVLRQIKASPEAADIPVIISTMDGKTESRVKCRELGCSGYLAKPVSVTSLHQTMLESLPAMGGKERKFLRATFTSKVKTFSKGTIAEYYAVSLSEGGIYLRKIDPLAVGTELVVTLMLDDGKNLELPGVVIYRREIFEHSGLVQPGMAIRFKDPGPVTSGLLRGFISRLLTSDILDEQVEEIITIKE